MNNTSVGELPKTIMNGRYFSLLVPPIYVITIFLGWWRIREASHFASSMVEFFNHL